MAQEIQLVPSNGLSLAGGGKKKKKGKKGRKGGDDDIFADEVQDMAIETGLMTGGERFVFSAMLDGIDSNEKVEASQKKEAKRNLCLKALVAGAIARRFLKRNTVLAAGARATMAIAAVNLGRQI